MSGLSRPFLESLLVAHAIVHPRERARILRDVDRDRVSPAAWALLEQLAAPDQELVQTRTEGQTRLADRAQLVTIAELLDYSLALTLQLCNGLPERAAPVRVQAWERDLARAGVAA